MKYAELISKSEAGRRYVKGVEVAVRGGAHYLWVAKIDRLLERVGPQHDILIQKFSNLTNVSQVHDKLSELMVGYQYLSLSPVFSSDVGNVSYPDIYLSSTKEYVEVKRINPSDYEKNLMEKLQKEGGVHYREQGMSQVKKDNEKQFVYRKARQHIDKALEQLKDKEGKIALVYSIDLSGHIDSQKYREEMFIDYVNSYFSSKNANKITLETINHSLLFC